MGSGVIISETTPEMKNRYTWIKPCVDGTLEFYEPTDGSWTKTTTLNTLKLDTLTVVSHLLVQDGKEGINANIKITDVGTLKFKGGVLIDIDKE